MIEQATLTVADGVFLPIEYVTQTCAILAQRRKGKTYTASVVAEELYALGLPWVALDPTGAWWGLRSSADGEHAGIPVVVIGGQHGDLPLEREAGAFIADLVLDHPGWYVIDLSLIDSRPAEREFATAFGERLLRRKMQRGMDFPFHLFIDEADMFLPQEKETRGDVALLAAYSGIVRRGGLHGLGSTLISQRPALINKNALTQLDLLVLLRLVAGNDQDAVRKNYVSRFMGKDDADALMATLAGLPIGEAWFLEPGAEPPLRVCARVRERRTFNSSATPKPGERRIEPSVFADVDLDALRARMVETLERAKDDDPAYLRSQIEAERRRRLDAESDFRDIAAWKTEVEQASDGPTAIDELIAVYQTAKRDVGYSVAVIDEARALAARTVQVAVPVYTVGDLDEVWKLVQAAKEVGEQLVAGLSEAAQPLAASILRAAEAAEQKTAAPSPSPTPAPLEPTPAPAPPAPVERPAVAPTATDLAAGARHLLATLAHHHPLRLSLGQLALLARRKARGGSWNTSMKQLRDGEYVEIDAAGLLVLTAKGISASGIDGSRPLSSEQRVAVWREALPAAALDIFDRLVAVYPNGRSVEGIAQDTGRTPRGGSWNSAISTLVRNGLAVREGEMLFATKEAVGG